MTAFNSMTTRIHNDGIRCKHCAKWHYGKSYVSTELALKMAEREIEKCRKHRESLQMPDEPIDDEVAL